ncbi:hypothetical protein J2S74_002713 [Evansella vedderi]|uniref:Uncharacterized protein n=1 Tax=Evansella vedderi TaxID=38282 RepID=A0ABT9ZVR2_9BACI|nr:hypothetical protein [Evansella vedderi]
MIIKLKGVQEVNQMLRRLLVLKVLHLGFGGQMIVQCQALREMGVDAMSCFFYKGIF